MRCGRRGGPGHVHDVLHRDRHARERTDATARPHRLVDTARLVERDVREDLREGVEARLQILDA